MTKAAKIESFTRADEHGWMWQDIHEPGAYVELNTGDLYRIPKEAFGPGSRLLIIKETRDSSPLVLVSKDPFVTAVEARYRCSQHNVRANF